MGARTLFAVILVMVGPLLVWIPGSSSAGCSYLSADAGCGQCDDRGYCIQGTVPIDPWLNFALKTQRDMQLDEPFFNVQILDGHNAFNTRADGYGINDTCAWPPPYQPPCMAFANQEFSFTDMLNMGIRGFEIDNYWCDNDMRMAHVGSDLTLICFERTKTFAAGMEEIGDWLKLYGNSKELIRIYLDRPGSSHPDLVNSILLESFGNRILTPAELEKRYNGVWPTMRTLQEDGNNVIVLINSYDDLGGVTIHKAQWTNKNFNEFTPYPLCGGKPIDDTWRLYGDGTHYPVVWDGPTQTGVTTDLTEVMKCHIQYPAMDYINPQLLKTAVFTWGRGEPSQTLSSKSCIYLSGDDHRWHVASTCSRTLYFACQHTQKKYLWSLSQTAGEYSLTDADCPPTYTFGIPQNGYRHQKLAEILKGRDVWINYSPWLPGYSPPPEPTTPSPSSSISRNPSVFMSTFAAAIMFLFH